MELMIILQLKFFRYSHRISSLLVDLKLFITKLELLLDKLSELIEVDNKAVFPTGRLWRTPCVLLQFCVPLKFLHNGLKPVVIKEFNEF